MPIRYSLGGLYDFMSFELKNSYVAAMNDIYGLDSSSSYRKDPFKGTIRHGVYTGTGLPLTASAMSPNNVNRVLLQVDKVDATKLGGTVTVHSWTDTYKV